MIDLRERRRQLLNLTITEIILILLFLVLLIAANLIQKNKKLTEENIAYKSLDVDAAQLIQFRKFEEAINDLDKLAFPEANSKISSFFKIFDFITLQLFHFF